MKILIAATSLQAQPIGGGETFIIDLANGLADEPDIAVAIVLGDQAHTRIAEQLHPAIAVKVVRQRAGSARVVSDLCLTGLRARSWGAEVTIYPHEWKPPSRTPTMLVIQNVLWMHPLTRGATGARGRLLRALTRLTGSRAELVVAVSGSAARLWLDLSRAQPATIQVLPEPLRLPAASTTSVSLHSGIVAVTGVSPYKGLGLLQEAARRLRVEWPDFCLDVVGAAGVNEASIYYHGFVDRRTLVGMMTDASMVVFPSYVESFGLPAFEAAAVGTKCVVQGNTPMTEWLGERLLTFDGSADDLVATIAQELRGELGAVVPEERFTWPSVSSDWVQACRIAAACRS